VLLALTVIGCASGTRPTQTAAEREAPAVVRSPTTTQNFEEAFVAQRGDDDDIQALITYPGGYSTYFVLASARGKDQLHRFEAATGKYVESHGQSGSGVGQFRAPRGMAIADALLFVVDSGNRRIQTYTLPRMIPQQSFGSEQLKNPVAVHVDGDGSGTYRVYVLDRVDGAQRLEQFEFSVAAVRRDVVVTRIEAEARHVGGRTLSASSPAGDPQAQFFFDPGTARVYLADGAGFYAFDRDLQALVGGPELPKLEGAATGVGGIICPKRTDQGYIIVGEQVGSEQRFNVYTREDLRLVARFAGTETTRNSTLAVIDKALAFFPAGAVYAVTERRAVAALDWQRIAKSAAIRAMCF
jgi:hypothetical protein